MAGILSADRIVESEKINQKIQSIGQEVSKLITAFDKVAESGDKLAKSLGGADNLNKIIKASKDTAKATEELTYNQAELAKQHQELGKVTAKLEEIESKYNKEIIKSKELIKQKNAIIKEEINGEKASAEASKSSLSFAAQQYEIEQKISALKKQLAIETRKTQTKQFQLLPTGELYEMAALARKIKEETVKLNAIKSQIVAQSLPTKLAGGTVDFQGYINGLTQAPLQLKKMNQEYAELEKESERQLAIEKRKTEELEKQNNLTRKQKLERFKLTEAVYAAPVGSMQQLNAQEKVLVFDKKNAESTVEIKRLTEEIEANRIAKEKLKATNKDLTESERKAAQATKLAAQEEKLKLAIQAQSEGSIKRLQAENQLHAFTIKNKLNPAIASEQAEILRLNKVIGTNKDAVSDMQRKNVTAWDRVTKSVFQHLAAYVGITQAIQLIKTIFNLTKELDSLHFSMGSVIKDQKELAATQSFLSDTSKKYGIDLLALSERYIKFRAATLQSNMTMKETMGIFNSMSKISAVLGLKTDEMSGVFLALEQMISKGKVTTEELRRQLGERLPGAFGIMANAVQKLHPELVVTLASLDKMLKAGTIISSEVLPEFARQAEIAFGTATTDKVNTLAAAQGRLKTSWIQFVEETKQSKNFIYLLNNLNNALSGIRYAFGGADELELYSSLTGKWGDAFSKVTKEIENLGGAGKDFFKDATKYHDMFVTALEKTGEPLEKIEKAWTQYVKKSKLMLSEENERAKKTTVFDPKSYKANLEDTLNEIETFNTTKDTSLKEAMKRTSDLFKSGSVTDITYLNKERNDIVKKSEDAWLKYDELQKKKTNNEKAFTKDEEIELVARYENYQGYIDARIDIDKRLNKGTISDKKAAKTRLQLAKESADQELFIFQQNQKMKLSDEVNALDELYSNRDKNARDAALYEAALSETEYNNKKETIDKEIELQNGLLKFVKGNKEEEAKITTDIEKLKRDQVSLTTDFEISQNQDQIKIRKANNKQEKDDLERESNMELMRAETNIHMLNMASIKGSQDKIKNAKGNAAKLKNIDDQLTLDLLENERKRLQKSLDSHKLNSTDFDNTLKRINEIEEAQSKKRKDITEYTEGQIQSAKQETHQKEIDLLNEGFNFAKQIFDAQLSRAEESYKSETNAAGDSLQEQIKAKRKYEKEVNQIRKRQAIADKAQAVMNIAFSTAQAIIAVWANPATILAAPALTALISAIGALQLATVLATPIPAFFKGTTNAPETFIAGDTPDGKGATELIHTKSGLDILTPSKATLFSDPMFKGAKIFPHDKTQEMLNSYAINGGSQVFVDMSGSEKYLNQIAKNTKNTEIKGVDSKGRDFIKRGSTVTTY